MKFLLIIQYHAFLNAKLLNNTIDKYILCNRIQIANLTANNNKSVLCKIQVQFYHDRDRQLLTAISVCKSPSCRGNALSEVLYNLLVFQNTLHEKLKQIDERPTQDCIEFLDLNFIPLLTYKLKSKPARGQAVAYMGVYIARTTWQIHPCLNKRQTGKERER